MIKLFMVLLFLVSCGSHPDHTIDCVDSCNGKNKKQVESEPKVIIGAKGSSGSNGSSGSDGINGTNGTNGQDGIDGLDGEGCSVTRVSNGAIIECANTSTIVYDGVDGINGSDSILEFINPCGDNSGHDEILIKTDSGELVAVYYDPPKTFLTFLEPNTSYRTTDGWNCNFSTDSNLNVIW